MGMGMGRCSAIGRLNEVIPGGSSSFVLHIPVRLDAIGICQMIHTCDKIHLKYEYMRCPTYHEKIICQERNMSGQKAVRISL